jgi:hypothetical protein
MRVRRRSGIERARWRQILPPLLAYARSGGGPAYTTAATDAGVVSGGARRRHAPAHPATGDPAGRATSPASSAKATSLAPD